MSDVQSPTSLAYAKSFEIKKLDDDALRVPLAHYKSAFFTLPSDSTVSTTTTTTSTAAHLKTQLFSLWQTHTPVVSLNVSRLKNAKSREQYARILAQSLPLDKDAIEQQNLSLKVKNNPLLVTLKQVFANLWYAANLGRNLVDGAEITQTMEDVTTGTWKEPDLDPENDTSSTNVKVAHIGWIALFWPIFLVGYILVYGTISAVQLLYVFLHPAVKKKVAKQLWADIKSTDELDNFYYKKAADKDSETSKALREAVDKYFDKIRAIINYKSPTSTDEGSDDTLTANTTASTSTTASTTTPTPDFSFNPDPLNSTSPAANDLLKWNLTAADFKGLYKLTDDEKKKVREEIDLIQRIFLNSQKVRFSQIRDRWAMLGLGNTPADGDATTAEKYYTTYHMLVHDDSISGWLAKFADQKTANFADGKTAPKAASMNAPSPTSTIHSSASKTGSTGAPSSPSSGDTVGSNTIADISKVEKGLGTQPGDLSADEGQSDSTRGSAAADTLVTTTTPVADPAASAPDIALAGLVCRIAFNSLTAVKKIPTTQDSAAPSSVPLAAPTRTIHKTLFSNGDIDEFLATTIPNFITPLSIAWGASSTILGYVKSSAYSAEAKTRAGYFFSALSLYSTFIVQIGFAYTHTLVFGDNFKSTGYIPTLSKNVSSTNWYVFDTYYTYLRRQRNLLAAALEKADTDLVFDDDSGFTDANSKITLALTTVVCSSISDIVLESIAYPITSSSSSTTSTTQQDLIYLVPGDTDFIVKKLADKNQFGLSLLSVLRFFSLQWVGYADTSVHQFTHFEVDKVSTKSEVAKEKMLDGQWVYVNCRASASASASAQTASAQIAA
ncbi:hypothetical protein BZA70DRAFT_83178 [Myxozyma melibiosi]|uniref:Uncharacterized protein n=1 Tax=Myxozyma melibiosi TaxID=54550 RepID=A0ABR1EZX4_9ASCO